MFLSLYAYFLKSAYYVYFVTISYYCGCCPVKEKDLDNPLLKEEVGQTVIVMATEKELKTKSVPDYNEKIKDIPGTMQYLAKKWQMKNKNKYTPFEQWYKLWLLKKVLQKEQQSLAPKIKLVLTQKKDQIQIIVQESMSIDLPDSIAEEIIKYTYGSKYACQYNLIQHHYIRLSKLVRLFYDYSPCYYLVAYSFLFFSAYYLTRYFSIRTPAKQFKKYPLKLHGITRKTMYDRYLKEVNDLGEQVSDLLSLCNNLNTHTITMEKGTPLQKALMSQNSTALKLAIADLSFHGIQQNNKEDYLLVPLIIDAWMINEKEVPPLTVSHFCEEAFFAFDWLADHIYDHTKIALQHSLEDIKAATLLLETYKQRSIMLTSLIMIFMSKNNRNANLTQQPPMMHKVIKGYEYATYALAILTAYCVIFE